MYKNNIDRKFKRALYIINLKIFLRALRLAKRCNITENNIRLRIMENMRQMKHLPEELKEEF
jgi:hypothetical protein